VIRVRMFAAALLMLSACTNAEAPTKREQTADEAKLDVPKAEPVPSFAPPANEATDIDDSVVPEAAAPSTVPRAPLPAGASEEDRRQHALELLAGGEVASRLPLRATDPGEAFNPSLADQMTPRVGARVPRIRQLEATVTGDLDRNIIRRVVRFHIDEVRACYNKALAGNPKAEGTVTVRFKIDGEGKVTKAKAKTKGKGLARMKSCVQKAFVSWTFPLPRDGKPVSVNYPLWLSPG